MRCSPIPSSGSSRGLPGSGRRTSPSGSPAGPGSSAPPTAASTTTSAGNSRRTNRITSGTGAQRRAGRQRGAQQTAAEEEPGQRQEHVDAAGHPAEPDVEHRDERDRDAAEAVEVVSVEARLAACRMRGARGGCPDRCRRRPGWGEGHHGRRSIYRRSRVRLMSRCDAVAAGSKAIRLDLHARVDARRDQRDRRRACLASLQHDRRRGAATGRRRRRAGRLADADRRRPAGRGPRRDELVVDRDPRPRPPGRWTPRSPRSSRR